MITENASGVLTGNCYSLTFTEVLSNEQIGWAIVHLEQYAKDHGISMQVRQNGFTFHFQFENRFGYLAMRHRFVDLENAQKISHIEHFYQWRPEFIRAWMREAKGLLVDAGMPHHVKEGKDAAVFSFHTNQQLVAFCRLRDSGFITAKARVHLRRRGEACDAT